MSRMEQEDTIGMDVTEQLSQFLYLVQFGIHQYMAWCSTKDIVRYIRRRNETEIEISGHFLSANFVEAQKASGTKSAEINFN
jgi:hypothetical protein